jgi:hypothetical protein
MRVAAIDIGKPSNIGWAIDQPAATGTNLDRCVDELASALAAGPVALGFEAPQFVPLRDDPMLLTKARPGEGSRAFSVGAGAAVLVTSLVTVPYVLQRLRERAPAATATFDWRQPLTRPGQLLLWEAFVTDQRKDTPGRHIEDAELAVAGFRRGIADPTAFESSVTVPVCFNLLGAALLRTGWSTDLRLLAAPCLVIRSGSPPKAKPASERAKRASTRAKPLERRP